MHPKSDLKLRSVLVHMMSGIGQNGTCRPHLVLICILGTKHDLKFRSHLVLICISFAY